MAGLEALQRRFAIAATEHHSRSPFNARLLTALAERPDVVGLLQSAPEEQQLPVLLLAAVHSIVLAEPDIELADWYPTVRAHPRGDDAVTAFVRLCREREPELRTIIATHSTQTNEVGRCALLLPVLSRLECGMGPLALVDAGTSAGLNLRLDRYAYDFDGTRVGEASPVALACGVRGPVPIPDALPTIAGRIGIDRAPIDLDDEQRVRWLMACVWPDQRDRFERLRAAIAIAREHPAEIIEGDAVATLANAVAGVRSAGHPVVMTSWVLNYLALDERRAFLDVLEALGAERDLSWIALECPGMCPGLPYPEAVEGSFRTHLILSRWRDGRRTTTHLAECHPHGYWMHWAG